MRRILLVLLASTFAWHAHAHGVPKPRHGGIVDVGGEMTFELVVTGKNLKVYVDDHGKPVATEGAVAALLLASETGKRLALLKATGGNSLTGTAVLPRGSRVFVRLTLANGSTEVGEIKIP